MAAEALEQSVLESKDKEQLLAIAKALGVKATTRTRKADIISLILETTNAASGPSEANGSVSNGDATSHSSDSNTKSGASAPHQPTLDASAVFSTAADASSGVEPAAVAETSGEPPAEWEQVAPEPAPAPSTRSDGPPRGTPRVTPSRPAPPSATSTAGAADGNSTSDAPTLSGDADQAAPQGRQQSSDTQQRDDDQQAGQQGDGEGRNRRRRRRRKGKGGREDNPQGDDRDAVDDGADGAANEPVPVEGYLDMRDEGYGFLRLNGYLPSREDSYIPVRMTRQYGLRKGDHVTGLSRPPQRNEKNPALLEVHTVNGDPAGKNTKRPRFDDLTALFPDQKLRLENPDDPSEMTARIIDLVSPIGKGQRGIIVSPPKAGKTTVMKTIARAIERNNPEVKLIVLLIDERPEEVTDMRRSVTGEVVASTFDRPSDEHTHVAEMTIEKAKRMVELGEDVVVILDGITRLSRAYNLAAPASGRILSGGIDAGALYPPKKFFGAARNVEEGGSLTILATALVETNSRMDEAIFEEFKGTGNMELRLDRKLSERRVFPAIDVDASSTRHEELLFDRRELQQAWKLRRVLSGLAAEGNAAPGLELLIDRLKTFRTNAEFLAEISKQATM